MQLTALTQGQAAALLSITPRALREWHDAPRNKDGTYPGPALVAYYVARNGGDDLDLNRERARLAKEQADRTALANAVARGDVIPAAVATQQWTDHIVAARARMLAIPPKYSPQVAGLSDVNVIASILKDAVHEALDELARWQPPSGSVETLEVAAELDRQPVGRPRKTVVERVERGAGAVEN